MSGNTCSSGLPIASAAARRLADAIHAFQWTIVRSVPSTINPAAMPSRIECSCSGFRIRAYDPDARRSAGSDARSSVCSAASDGMSIIIAR